MPFAICRIQKIKSWGQLTAHEGHINRTRETPNANPEVENIQIVGNLDELDLCTLVKNKIGSQKIRSNAVLAIEMLLSASADYFRPQAPLEGGVYDKRRLDNFVDAVSRWLDSSWGDRVVRAELHLDEITPHIHAYLVPLDEQGKLRCKALFGTHNQMYQLQDSFAAAVAHLGIERGIKGSLATHTQVRKYYAAVNQDSQILNLEHCLPQPEAQETSKSYRQRVIEILNPQLEIINHQLNERSLILQQKAELKQTASKSEQLRQQLERELHLLQATNGQQDLSLPLVAHELGANNYKQDDNALSLVMRVNECQFDDAVVWLRDRFGENGMLHAVANHALTIAQHTSSVVFVAPFSSPNQWNEVQRYLTQQRALPPQLLQTLHKRSLVYASVTGGTVFLARNLLNEPTGAYLHTPGDNTFNLYPSSRRSCGWFHLSIGGKFNEPTKGAMLVSSPIEALSLAVLNAPHKHKTLYLVIDSQYSQLPREFLENVPNVVVATINETAITICQALPNATRLEPQITWNQQLQQQGGKNHAVLEPQRNVSHIPDY
ncbi:plasmid recombination enzyme [Calothrix sp. PCC 7716]|nr:plasmid recombination enzyme [Calothrix sp. PCC 7716]